MVSPRFLYSLWYTFGEKPLSFGRSEPSTQIVCVEHFRLIFRCKEKIIEPATDRTENISIILCLDNARKFSILFLLYFHVSKIMFSLQVLEKPTFHYTKNVLDEIVAVISNTIDIAQNGTLNIIFLDPDGIQNLNKTYRNIDTSTDVLSFHYFDDFSVLQDSDIA